MVMAGEHEPASTPRGIAVRTTLAAAAAELEGEWDEVEFLAASIPLLPEPEAVAWAAMYLTKANLGLVDPPPEPGEAAVAAALCASQGFAPEGAASVASVTLSTALRSLRAPAALDPAPMLVASTGMLLLGAPEPSLPTAVGLFVAVTYAIVRASMALDVAPIDTVQRLIARLS